MPELVVSTRASAELLHALLRQFHLSDACATGNHLRCPSVSPFTLKPCCCTECGHVDLTGPAASLPLLRLDEDGYRHPAYTYGRQEPLGVVAELVDNLAPVLEGRVPAPERPELAWQLAVAAALTFAARSG